MAKKRAAFIDHSFHKKTKSTDFIKEILSEKFDITCYYDESWNGGKEVDIKEIKKNNYEYIFYFQRIHNIRNLLKIRNLKIVFFPMEDSLGFKKSDWLIYALIPIKIICFSKKLFVMLTSLKIKCIYVQYFINPDLIRTVNDYTHKNIFFWNRTEDINWRLIKKILGNNKIDSFTLMTVPDPNHKINHPDGTDIKKYNIKIYEKFLDEDEYINIVSNADIYFAPRKYEGIGMSFLEALTRGQCVIAPNYSTMNEYIENNVNGYLYKLDNVKKIDLSNFEFIGKEARRRTFIGYEKWKRRQVDLLNYILQDEQVKGYLKIIATIKIGHFMILEFPATIKRITKKLRKL